MPVEIRELNIKVSVSQQAATSGTTGTQAATSNSQGGGGVGKDEIIAECVEQIMEILHNKKER